MESEIKVKRFSIKWDRGLYFEGYAWEPPKIKVGSTKVTYRAELEDGNVITNE